MAEQPELFEELVQKIVRQAGESMHDPEPFLVANARRRDMLQRRLEVTRTRVGLATFLRQRYGGDDDLARSEMRRLGVGLPQMVDMAELHVNDGRLDLLFQLLQPALFHVRLPWNEDVRRVYVPPLDFGPPVAARAAWRARLQTALTNVRIYYAQSSEAVQNLCDTVRMRELYGQSSPLAERFYAYVEYGTSPAPFKTTFRLEGPDKTWHELVEAPPEYGPLPVTCDYRDERSAPLAIFPALKFDRLAVQLFLNNSGAPGATLDRVPSLDLGLLNRVAFFYQSEKEALRRLATALFLDGDAALRQAYLDVALNASSPLRTDPFLFNACFGFVGHAVPYAVLMDERAETIVDAIDANVERLGFAAITSADQSAFATVKRTFQVPILSPLRYGPAALVDPTDDGAVFDVTAIRDYVDGLSSEGGGGGDRYWHWRVSASFLERCFTHEWRHTARYFYRPSLWPVYEKYMHLLSDDEVDVLLDECLLFPTEAPLRFFCQTRLPLVRRPAVLTWWWLNAERCGGSYLRVHDALLTEFNLWNDYRAALQAADVAPVVIPLNRARAVLETMTSDDARAAVASDLVAARECPVFIDDDAEVDLAVRTFGALSVVRGFDRLVKAGLVAFSRCRRSTLQRLLTQAAAYVHEPFLPAPKLGWSLNSPYDEITFQRLIVQTMMPLLLSAEARVVAFSRTSLLRTPAGDMTPPGDAVATSLYRVLDTLLALDLAVPWQRAFALNLIALTERDDIGRCNNLHFPVTKFMWQAIERIRAFKRAM